MTNAQKQEEVIELQKSAKKWKIAKAVKNYMDTMNSSQQTQISEF